jgi:hypothetical protein
VKTFELSCVAEFFLESETFQKKTVVGKLKIHILCSVTLFSKLGHCEIIWKNTVEHGKPQVKV